MDGHDRSSKLRKIPKYRLQQQYPCQDQTKKDFETAWEGGESTYRATFPSDTESSDSSEPSSNSSRFLANSDLDIGAEDGKCISRDTFPCSSARNRESSPSEPETGRHKFKALSKVDGLPDDIYESVLAEMPSHSNCTSFVFAPASRRATYDSRQTQKKKSDRGPPETPGSSQNMDLKPPRTSEVTFVATPVSLLRGKSKSGDELCPISCGVEPSRHKGSGVKLSVDNKRKDYIDLDDFIKKQAESPGEMSSYAGSVLQAEAIDRHDTLEEFTMQDGFEEQRLGLDEHDELAPSSCSNPHAQRASQEDVAKLACLGKIFSPDLANGCPPGISHARRRFYRKRF
jgi:hypothetical protein